jgi:hypothetical protein
MKDKSININIRNTNNNIIKDKKKRKRRSRRSKNSKKKQQALGQPIQAVGPSSVTSYPSYNNDNEAKKNAENYISPKNMLMLTNGDETKTNKNNLMLTNGDETKTNKNNLMLTNGDEAKTNKNNLMLTNGDETKKTNKTITKKTLIETPIKTPIRQYIMEKSKPIEYTQEGLMKVKTLKLLRELMKTAMPSIDDKLLKKISNENKSEAIKKFLSKYNKPSDKTTPTKFTTQSATTEPDELTPKKPVETPQPIKFTTQTATTEPPDELKQKPVQYTQEELMKMTNKKLQELINSALSNTDSKLLPKKITGKNKKEAIKEFLELYNKPSEKTTPKKFTTQVATTEPDELTPKKPVETPQPIFTTQTATTDDDSDYNMKTLHKLKDLKKEPAFKKLKTYPDQTPFFNNQKISETPKKTSSQKGRKIQFDTPEPTTTEKAINNKYNNELLAFIEQDNPDIETENAIKQILKNSISSPDA